MPSAAASAPKATGIFKGDAPELVHALVEACEARPSGKLPESILRRQLVPAMETGFFDMPEPEQAAPKRAQNNGAKAVAGNNKRKGDRSPPQARCPAAEATTPKAPAAKPAAPQNKAAQNKAPRSGPSPPKASPSNMVALRGLAAPGGFACPAFFSSPKPEALPMPSSCLLARALVPAPAVAVAAGM